MSFVYLPVGVVDCSQPSGCLAGEQSATSRMNPTALTSLKPESGTGCLTTPRSGTTPEHSTGDPGVDAWILSLRASRASPSVPPASDRENKTSETSGPKPSESYAKWDPDSACWRTYQVSFLTNTTEPFSGSFPRAGLMHHGRLYRRRKWERRISEIGSGLWPTPKAFDAIASNPERVALLRAGKNTFKSKSSGISGGIQNLADHVTARQMFPTPTADRWDGLQSHGKNVVTDQLNPTWVEWLMGWPLGWTALEPLETDKFRLWLEQHGKS